MWITSQELRVEVINISPGTNSRLFVLSVCLGVPLLISDPAVGPSNHVVLAVSLPVGQEGVTTTDVLLTLPSPLSSSQESCLLLWMKQGRQTKGQIPTSVILPGASLLLWPWVSRDGHSSYMENNMHVYFEKAIILMSVLMNFLISSGSESLHCLMWFQNNLPENA